MFDTVTIVSFAYIDDHTGDLIIDNQKWPNYPKIKDDLDFDVAVARLRRRLHFPSFVTILGVSRVKKNNSFPR